MGGLSKKLGDDREEEEAAAVSSSKTSGTNKALYEGEEVVDDDDDDNDDDDGYGSRLLQEELYRMPDFDIQWPTSGSNKSQPNHHSAASRVMDEKRSVEPPKITKTNSQQAKAVVGNLKAESRASTIDSLAAASSAIGIRPIELDNIVPISKPAYSISNLDALKALRRSSNLSRLTNNKLGKTLLQQPPFVSKQNSRSKLIVKTDQMLAGLQQLRKKDPLSPHAHLYMLEKDAEDNSSRDIFISSMNHLEDNLRQLESSFTRRTNDILTSFNRFTSNMNHVKDCKDVTVLDEMLQSARRISLKSKKVKENFLNILQLISQRQ